MISIALENLVLIKTTDVEDQFGNMSILKSVFAVEMAITQLGLQVVPNTARKDRFENNIEWFYQSNSLKWDAFYVKLWKYTFVLL